MSFIGYEYVTSQTGLEKAIRAVTETKVIGLDIETVRDVLDPTGKISLIQVCTGSKLFVVDSIILGEDACRPLAEAIGDEGIIKIIHHAKFEQKWFYKKYGVELWPIFDTYRASAIIDNGRELPHDLYSVYERYLSMAPPTQDLGGSDWEKRPLSEEQKAYAASDVKFLHALRETMKPVLSSKGLNTVAKIEFGVVLPESVVELNGFPIDKQMWLSLYEHNLKKSEEYRKQLAWELPRAKAQLMLGGIEPDINVNSTQQVLASLKLLGVPIEDTKNETLTLWAADYPLVEKLLGYRDYGQAVKMFGPDYLDALNKWDGRFHPQYFPFTGAGRYSCKNKNLQQVPRKFEFRDCFRPKPGRKFVICDWSNIEMRIAAELSQDEKLLHIFRSPEFLPDGSPNREADAHYVTASFITGKSLWDIVKAERQNAKPVNFGFLYNMQAARLVIQARTEYGITMSLKQAREYRELYFEKYIGVKKWHDKIFGSKNKTVKTIAGRLRYLPDDAFNELANTPVQGAGADGLKTALRNVYFAFKDDPTTDIVHHVHDEVILETDDDADKLEEVQTVLEKVMIDSMQQYLKTVPVAAEAKVGASWAEK